MQKLLITLFTVTLFTACQFDGSSMVAPSDDPATDLACESDRDCQEAGFDCNVYTCGDENRCEVMDVLCEDDYVCRVGGCETAPVAECTEHYECVPDDGCESAYCTEDGSCESYSCGPSLGCESDTDCAEGRYCNANSGNCERSPDCTSDTDCASDEHCSSGSCVADTVVTGDLEINCASISGIRVTFSGDISTGIVLTDGDLPGTPGKVSFGANAGIGSGTYWPSTSSGIDTSLPTCDVAVDNDGKWTCASYLEFGDSVQEFNFIVANSANNALRYFDLSKWDVTGYCAKATQGGICSCTSLPCSCD